MVHAPTLQRTLEQTTISETEAMAKQLLSLGRISEVEAYLERQRNADSAV
jgi:hypothetical protein